MPFSLTELTTNCYKAPPNEIVIAAVWEPGPRGVPLAVVTPRLS